MEPGGAAILWLREGQSAPVTVICGAPELEPRVKHPFGRAPAGAGVGAARGALPNRALAYDG